MAFGFWFSVPSAVAQSSQAGTKLQAADNAVNQAFGAALDAEKAGANVTDLLTQLNGAADLLAQAEIAFRQGDFNSAGVKADSVLPIAAHVSSAAKGAESVALTNGQVGFWLSIGLFVGGSVVLVSMLFFVWRWFKKNHFKTVLDAKPEVSSSET